MPSVAESGVTLEGLFKRRYADKLERSIPEDNSIQQDVKFNVKKKIGENYNVPIRVRHSGGQTYAVGATALTAYALNDASPGQMKNAQITSQAYTKRVQVPYITDFRSQNTEAAFGEAFDEIVMDAKEAAHYDLEVALMYGASPTGLGAIATNAPSGTSAVVTLTAAQWGAGLFTQSEGMYFEVFDSTLTTNRTAAGPAQLTGLNVDTRGFTLVCASAGNASAIVATDVIMPYGWYVAGSGFNVMSGIDKIVTNTGSLFNIDASVYGLWRGNTYDAGAAPLTMTKLGNACVKALVKGGRGKVTAYVSPWAWSDINNDTAGLRRFVDSTRSEVELGTQRLKFYGPSGEITLTAHINVKAGEAFVLQTDRWERVGSSEPVFGYPDGSGDRKFLNMLPNNNGYEFRCLWDQAMLCRAPARQVKITNITNSSGP